ncbi:hypothetical protein F2Q69_00014970 [Brassica cretica]|uniref:Uncharacterized protein n=1 Tax=Brassica cretica TaxID=69181 RepID=A0A8S9R8A1_BRACR|nr:hypothetical protein F2Q69_00014970 [Brassica cretica]
MTPNERTNGMDAAEEASHPNPEGGNQEDSSTGQEEPHMGQEHPQTTDQEQEVHDQNESQQQEESDQQNEVEAEIVGEVQPLVGELLHHIKDIKAMKSQQPTTKAMHSLHIKSLYF